MGASTYYIITFLQIFDTSPPLCDQASSLRNSPPIIMSTSCEPHPSTSSPTFFREFFDKRLYFVMLHKLAKFHYQTVFTSQVIK